ncbi:hypothetical protein IWW51_005947 [Coemansia sp. RSA 2702]|nr:hypothetical protein IWW51_005947 [Coemansia sp. RSA 2702]
MPQRASDAHPRIEEHVGAMAAVYPYSYSIASHIRRPARSDAPPGPPDRAHTKSARSVSAIADILNCTDRSELSRMRLPPPTPTAHGPRVDVDLMSKFGYTIEQLMELAGLSVAESIAAEYRPGKVLLCIGPGNNGGDGLVAARHLAQFGFCASLFYPKQPAKSLYQSLVRQCEAFNIPVVQDLDAELQSSDIVVDALFGFSFKGTPRAPFDKVLESLRATNKPIIAVDIPSGWDVEAGNPQSTGILPDMLVSLTAPKLCAKAFAGRFHYLGGRFIPPEMAETLGIPAYPGASNCLRLQID